MTAEQLEALAGGANPDFMGLDYDEVITGLSLRVTLANTLAKAARDYISGPLDDFDSGYRLRAALSAYEAVTRIIPRRP